MFKRMLRAVPSAATSAELGGRPMFKKILHANDGSDPAFKALGLALAIASQNGAQLHMVCVEELPYLPEFAEDVREALLGENNRLRDLFDYVVAYERGDWDRRVALAQRLGIDEGAVAALYKKALDWGRATFVPELLRV